MDSPPGTREWKPLPLHYTADGAVDSDHDATNTQNAGSGLQAQARLRVEQVDLGDVADRDLDLLADGRRGAAVDPDHEPLVAVADADRTMHIGVRAEFLDQFHGHREAL